MSRNLAFAALAAGLLATGTASSDDSALRARFGALFEPVPDQLPQIADNPVTAEKIDLGRMLFFDPRLSASGVISCNSCHNLGTGGDDNRPTSIGHGWQRGPRNSPTVYNAVYNVAQFWDGRAEDLKTQAKGPVQAGVEMANEPARVVSTLKSLDGYVTRFAAAFPRDPEPVTFDNMARAIEAFEATLVTPSAPFDRWLAGDDDAMTDEQKRGLEVFVNRGCAGCHNGVNLGGQSYYPFGLVRRPDEDVLPRQDKGRFAVTRTAGDEYVFRAAPLRNVVLTAPYFHSGQVWDLGEAVAIMGTAQLGAALGDEEVDQVVAFLRALTGRRPRVEYPELPVESATTPRPTR